MCINSESQLRYKPDPRYFGDDTIWIGLSDQGFTGGSVTADPMADYTTGTELGARRPLSTASTIPVHVTYFNWPPVQVRRAGWSGGCRGARNPEAIMGPPNHSRNIGNRHSSSPAKINHTMLGSITPTF